MLPIGGMEWFSILSDYSQYQHRIHDDIIDMIPGCDVNGNIMMLRNKLWSRDGYCFIGEIVVVKTPVLSFHRSIIISGRNK